MSSCYRSGDFKRYFTENMEGLGLPVPSGLFDTYQTAVATAGTLAATLAKLGRGATLKELIGATIGLERLMVAASIGASAYTGAVIGSIAVASGRTLACGSRISDLFVFTRQHNIPFSGLVSFYMHHPEIIDKSGASRSDFGAIARIAPSSFEHAS